MRKGVVSLESLRMTDTDSCFRRSTNARIIHVLLPIHLQFTHTLRGMLDYYLFYEQTRTRFPRKLRINICYPPVDAEDVCEGKKHSLRFRFTRKHARNSIITMLPGELDSLQHLRVLVSISAHCTRTLHTTHISILIPA